MPVAGLVTQFVPGLSAVAHAAIQLSKLSAKGIVAIAGRGAVWSSSIGVDVAERLLVIQVTFAR